jgi:hypothetical protein
MSFVGMELAFALMAASSSQNWHCSCAVESYAIR